MIQELDEAEQSFGSSSGTTAGSTVAGTNKEVHTQLGSFFFFKDILNKWENPFKETHSLLQEYIKVNYLEEENQYRCIFWSLANKHRKPRWLSGKESVFNEGDVGLIPGSARSPGEGNGNPLQYSCLENPMDRGAWWATVHRVAKESDMIY